MAKKNAGLGRGLEAIFLDNQTPENEADKENRISKLRISLVDPKSDQPRKYFDKDALEELAASITENGLLQPILVREYGEGRYQIIAGERRFRASKLAGLSEIPAVVLDGDDLKAAQVSVIENVQREDLNPLEEAQAYDALIRRFGLTQEQVSKQVGKSRTAITNILRLLQLPEAVLELLRRGDISEGHARALLGLKNRDQMISLAQKIVEKELSVRDVERTVRLMNYDPAEVEEEDEGLTQRKVYMKELEHRAVTILGRRVKILKTGKKKVVELAYSDDEDLEALLKTICGDEIFANND